MEDISTFFSMLSFPYIPKIQYVQARKHVQDAYGANTSNTQYNLTEFRQPPQVQSHLEMPGILVQLGHIQRT